MNNRELLNGSEEYNTSIHESKRYEVFMPPLQRWNGSREFVVLSLYIYYDCTFRIVSCVMVAANMYGGLQSTTK